jgi:D-alanyl-D-alanine carboxypeptidase/D-alanyl-D-alanine-endopeptidase (penicillin-binding protein 4)
MSPQRRRRLRRSVALAGALVVVLVVALVVTLDDRGPSGPPPATGPAIPAAGPVLAGYPMTSAPLPTEAGLAKALAAPLKQPNLGSHISVEVADMASGKLLYGRGATSPTTPASTMKLATTLAVLATRGPNYRITTHVVAGPKPGQVVLVGAGDPTLSASTTPNYPEGPSMAGLADQVKRSLGGVKPTQVIIDTSLFPGPAKGPMWQESDVESTYLTRVYALTTDGGRIDPGNIGDAPRYRDSATGAGAVFAKDLGLPASAVVSGEAPAIAPTGSPATTPGAVLGSVQSAPLVRIIETMLANSDNMLAEFMARQVALATGYPASFAGAAAAVTHELTKLGMPTQGIHIVDGSGISHLDRLTPALLTAVLAYASNPAHPTFHAMFTGLPVAGYSGTLDTRFRTKDTLDADGMLRAKTGTLNFTNSLAGYVIDESGRPLILVVLLDKTAWAGVRPAVDKIGAAIRACGCTSPAG